MAVTGFSISPGAAEFAPDPVLNMGIERAAAAMRVFRDLVTEVPFTGPGGSLDLVQLDALSASAYSTEGGARTFTAGNPTELNYAPAEIDVAMEFSDKLMRRAAINPIAAYTPEISRAVAVKIDADVAALSGSLTGTATSGGSDWSIAEVIQTIGTVRQAAKDQVGGIAAVLHTAGWDSLVTDSNVISAQARGDSQSLFSGMLTIAGGAQIHFTTGIETSATPISYNSMVFTRRSMVIVFKSAFNFEAWREPNNKVARIAGGADYIAGVRYAGEGAEYNVTV